MCKDIALFNQLLSFPIYFQATKARNPKATEAINMSVCILLMQVGHALQDQPFTLLRASALSIFIPPFWLPGMKSEFESQHHETNDGDEQPRPDQLLHRLAWSCFCYLPHAPLCYECILESAHSVYYPCCACAGKSVQLAL